VAIRHGFDDPDLLEVPNVPEIPDDRAHELVVLCARILTRERVGEQERALARFREQARYLGAGESATDMKIHSDARRECAGRPKLTIPSVIRFPAGC